MIRGLAKGGGFSSNMKPKLTRLGSSIKVPIVQDLAKDVSSTVPPRYVRPDVESILVSDQSSASSELPILNMNVLLQGDSMDSELDKLHNACQEWGFFQIINHGVDIAVVEKMKLEIQEFFNLPTQEKKKYSQEPGDIEGYGQAFVVSEEQKLDWADIFYAVSLPTSLRKPHLIPKLPVSFRDAIEAYAAELKNLAMKILQLMAKALQMKEEDMNTLFDDGLQAMRMNYYPPCPQPELVTGLSPHSDSIALTILLQINEIEGLQIKKDGVWIPVSPLPDAFIINIGDILEIVTNGAYRSIEHRATVNLKMERLSIATFLSPELDVEFGPAPSLVTGETPAKFRRISTVDYFKQLFARKLDGKSYVDAMRI